MAMRLPRNVAIWLSRARAQVGAVEFEPRHAAPGRARQQVHEGQRRQRLAAARFADQAQRLALAEREGDAAHGVQHAGGRRNVDAQVLDREEAHAAAPDHGDMTSVTPTRSPVAASPMTALGQA